MKRTWILLACLSLVASIALSCTTDRVDSVMKRGIKRMLENRAQAMDMLKDPDMHVILVGSGGPLDNEERLASCTAIIAGGEFIVVDLGAGTWRNVNLLNLPSAGLSAVFLTHFHSDHIADLGETDFGSWTQGRKTNLDVYGPEGVDQVVRGFSMAYALDKKYRIAHHGEDIVPPGASAMVSHTIDIKDPDEGVLFFDRNGLKAYAFMVDHFPVVPAVGYRFEYKGNVVVITGDTVKTPTLAKHAKNADILISEGLSMRLVNLLSETLAEENQPRLSKIMKDVLDYHIDPVQAGEVAQEAGAKKLVFNHVVPPITNRIAKSVFLRGVKDVYDGQIILGEDGMRFALAPKE
jgi:ribonuclease Z